MCVRVHARVWQRCMLSLAIRRTLARSKGVGAAVTIGAQSFLAMDLCPGFRSVLWVT